METSPVPVPDVVAEPSTPHDPSPDPPGPAERPDDAAVVATDLTRSFGTALAVAGLTLEVARGETFGLLGHNGAGKTTTIRLLNGVLAPDSGSARVLGFDPVRDGTRLRARTGVLTETPSLDERLTARENLAFFGRLYGLSGQPLASRVSEVLGSFGLRDRADDRVGGYSRGMKQRVALARTLLHDPDILFLDEPTAAIDPVATREVHDLVEGFGRDRRRTVVLCTHNLVEAQRLCDRVAILRKGALVAIGTPAELAASVDAAVVVEIDLGTGDRQAALAVLADTAATHVETIESGVTLRAARSDIPRIVAALAAAGCSIFRVASVDSDLEAAYFALHGLPPTEEGPTR